MTAWIAVLAAARKLGLPRAFRGDLRHDRRALMRGKRAARFVWAIGECGSFLAWIGVRSPRRTEALARTVLEMFPHVYLWDGSALAPCDPRDLASLLCEETRP